MTRGRPVNYEQIDPEQFVKVWQGAKTFGEVEGFFAGKIPANTLYTKACWFRKHGVKLKYFRTPVTDWKKLAKLAERR